MDLSDTSFETERLLVRSCQVADAEALAELMTPSISACLATWPAPLTVAQARAIVVDFIEAATVGKALGAVIISKQTGEIVGWFKIDLSEAPEVVGEFGYWIGEAHQRKGYAYEITREAFDFAFHVLNVTVMRAGARLDNDASLKLFEKLGMTCVGSERFWTPARERYEDCAFWEYEKPRR